MIDLATVRRVVLSDYALVCVASSVHLGRHERTAVEFVRNQRAELERLSAVFVSAALSEGGVENLTRLLNEGRELAAEVQRMIVDSVKETGWHPARVFPVAGTLTYTRYNLQLRFVMKRIARKGITGFTVRSTTRPTKRTGATCPDVSRRAIRTMDR